MQKELPVAEYLLNGHQYFLPSVSIDNVIFGFHQNELKVLLLQVKGNQNWVLPGGHIYKNEEIEEAAARVLKSRTGLSSIFLQQFHAFGGTQRHEKILKNELEHAGYVIPEQCWILQRFVTIGYYALVEYSKVNPKPDEFSGQCAWHNLDNLPELLFDHKQIIEKAMQAMRLQINYQPIGYNLLPEEFPLKSLQTIYETILGRKLERSNFNRKLLSYGILEKKQKHYSGAAHKAPFLYSFNKEMYFEALKNGMEKDF
jgi:8-oxo-dGTP diphosphatase